jgi:hypothetical protein
MQYKVMGVVFINGDGPCFKIQHTIKNFPLPINKFNSDSLKHTCLESYSPRLCEAVFQQCKPFLKHAKGNHRFESNLDLICNDLMECGRKIKFGTSPFSQIYISEPLHYENKVQRSSNLLKVILFLGKHKAGNVVSYSFNQKHNIQGPKKDQGKMKHNHLIVYEPNRLNLHITAHGDLTTVHFAIHLDVYEYCFKDETPSRDKKWVCYNKSLDMNIKEYTYMAYRYECIKYNNIIKNVPYEVRAINFYEKASPKRRRRT